MNYRNKRAASSFIDIAMYPHILTQNNSGFVFDYLTIFYNYIVKNIIGSGFFLVGLIIYPISCQYKLNKGSEYFLINHFRRIFCNICRLGNQKSGGEIIFQVSRR